MISAMILAAGKSTRMGTPKMLLPWPPGTILGHIISVFGNAGLEDILVMTGAERDGIESLVRELSGRYRVRCVFNPDYETGEMLSSIQCGLRDLIKKSFGAVLIGLGDQPQVEERSVRQIRKAYEQTGHPLIVPSFQMRRGHPWLVGREFWEEILRMKATQTPRDFLIRHENEIHYVYADTASIIADLDTPDEYSKAFEDKSPK